MVYPVMCVLSNDDHHDKLIRDVGSWSSDQDWHRGDFILYVEETRKSAEDLLVELLDPDLEELPQAEEARSLSSYLAELEAWALDQRNSAGEHRSLAAEFASLCAQFIRASSDRYDRSPEQLSELEKQNVLTEWTDRIVSDARALAVGGRGN